MIEAPCLTDLSDDRFDFRTRCSAIIRTGCRAVWEVLTALPRDLAHGLQRNPMPLRRIEAGDDPDADATRIALYVHYSGSGRISGMVQQQIMLLRKCGFSVVFITMAECIPEEDWHSVRHLAVLVVQRQNFGLDFGAWRDVMPEVRRRWPVLHELLLANDSVLGPIHPLSHAIDAIRAGGDGLFGLTESLQHGPHLQSYLLLTRGTSAVADLMDFVQNLRISHSKWLLVRRSEVRLSGWMRRRGHRVAALFGYDKVVKAAVERPKELRHLGGIYRRLENLERLSNDAAIGALHCWPLNPTHHLWRVLATEFNHPFLKTELIRRNPIRLPGVAEWQSLVPPDAPCTLPMIKAHLATLERDPTEREVHGT